MHEITVGELRQLLAHMPDDTVLRAHTDGDETARLELVPPGQEYGRWLEKIEPGDDWQTVAEREAARAKAASEAAERFRRMLDGSSNPTEGE